jgi:hypothetical protein
MKPRIWKNPFLGWMVTSVTGNWRFFSFTEALHFSLKVVEVQRQDMLFKK